MKVACLGDSFVDVQVSGISKLPTWGTDTSCEMVRLLPGGSCANAARHLGCLGAHYNIEVLFYSGIGADEFGQYFRKRVTSEGISSDETLHVLPCPQSTCVVLSGAMDRAMVSCYSSVSCEYGSHSLIACEPRLLLPCSPQAHFDVNTAPPSRRTGS